jgi:hypothetical protein
MIALRHTSAPDIVGRASIQQEFGNAKNNENSLVRRIRPGK